jgi:hypothetical protein
MADVIGVGTGLEPAVDDMRGRVEFNVVIFVVRTRVLSMLFGELNPYIPHERMSARLDELGVVFVQHFLMY